MLELSTVLLQKNGITCNPPTAMQTLEPTPKIMHMILASPTLKVRFTTYRTAFSVQLSYMMSALYEFPTVG